MPPEVFFNAGIPDRWMIDEIAKALRATGKLPVDLADLFTVREYPLPGGSVRLIVEWA